MQTIPQAMQAIRQNVQATCRDLAHAQNAVYAMLGRETIPVSDTAQEVGDTLPAMLLTVQAEFDATEAAFASLAEFVHDWTTGLAIPPEVEARAQERVARVLAIDAERQPEPLVAPTLASNLHKPLAIDTMPEVPTDDEPTEEPDGDEETATTIATENEANFDKEIAEVAAHHNRIAGHMNGHVQQGDELATVLDSPSTLPAVEESGGRKGRQRNRKGK